MSDPQRGALTSPRSPIGFYSLLDDVNREALVRRLVICFCGKKKEKTPPSNGVRKRSRFA